MLTLVRQSVPRSLGETDSHAGDIGHWLGMTGLIHVRTRHRIGRFILYHKEITMQTVIDFINKHLYDVMKEKDAIYRDVAWELKHEAAAQAAREAASHTLESGAAALEEHEKNTEDKGDTENG